MSIISNILVMIKIYSDIANTNCAVTWKGSSDEKIDLNLKIAYFQLVDWHKKWYCLTVVRNQGSLLKPLWSEYVK